MFPTHQKVKFIQYIHVLLYIFLFSKHNTIIRSQMSLTYKCLSSNFCCRPDASGIFDFFYVTPAFRNRCLDSSVTLIFKVKKIMCLQSMISLIMYIYFNTSHQSFCNIILYYFVFFRPIQAA